MEQVSYALREDPNTIFLLQDASNYYYKYCQITVFERNIVRPEFFGQYLYFAPNSGGNWKYHGSATDVQISIEDNSFTPGQNYVAIIDSEVEFRITPSVIRQLGRDYMPAWGVKSYLDYFRDRKSGVLLFLRVYKVNQSLSPSYLQKGFRGSAQILKLYDELGEEIALPVDGMEPVVSDNKFSYLKDEILHMLKVENAFIALYDNTKSGLNSLDERVVAERRLHGTRQKWEDRNLQWLESDDDSDFDMAQLDYEAIYQEVLKICPSMENMIDYVKSRQAARLGEYGYCLKDVHSHSNNESASVNRIFDMSIRSAVKNALNYHKQHGVDLEDAFQVGCIGVLMAIQKHNENVEGLFPSYASMWMRQISDRDLSLYDINMRIPVHYQFRIRDVLKQLGLKNHRLALKHMDYDEFYSLLLNNTDCDEDEALKIAYVLYPAESIEQILEDSYLADMLVDENNALYYAESIEQMMEDSDRDDLLVNNDFYQEKSIEQILEDSYLADMLVDENNELYDSFELLSYRFVYDSLDTLNKRERDVINRRYGFDGFTESTLEEIGKHYDLTRERIRQIEKKSFRKIVRYLYGREIITKEQYSALYDEHTIRRSSR